MESIFKEIVVILMNAAVQSVLNRQHGIADFVQPKGFENFAERGIGPRLDFGEQKLFGRCMTESAELALEGDRIVRWLLKLRGRQVYIQIGTAASRAASASL